MFLKIINRHKLFNKDKMTNYFQINQNKILKQNLIYQMI